MYVLFMFCSIILLCLRPDCRKTVFLNSRGGWTGGLIFITNIGLKR